MFAQFYEICYQPACLHQSGMSLVQLPERKMPREITQIKVCQTEPTPDRRENQLRGGGGASHLIITEWVCCRLWSEDVALP